MKLNSKSIQRVQEQLDGRVVPDHPAFSPLYSTFGDHTFFLGVTGVTIVELIGSTDRGIEKGQVIKVAEWTDENYTCLVPHPPQPTDEVVVLESVDQD